MFSRTSLFALLTAGAIALVPTSADAHRRWLLPSATVMSSDKATISVDAAVSNGLFVTDYRPLGLDGLKVVGPNGQPVEAKVIGSGEHRSVFDVPLTTPGTYRIALASDGMMASYELNGERKRWRGNREQMATAIPAGATNVQTTETNSRTETFATLGAPNDVALKPVGRGLEMVPVTHPNDLVAGEPAQLKFLLDGKPASDLEIEFVAGGTRYRNDAGIQNLKTDAQGQLTLKVDQPGYYYLEASHSSGEGQSPSKRYSYTAVLEFLPL